MKTLLSFILSAMIFFLPRTGFAADYTLKTNPNVLAGSKYNNCSITDLGDGTSQVSLGIRYNKASIGIAPTAANWFVSRAVVILTYDAAGVPHPTSNGIIDVTMNGVSYLYNYPIGGVIMYSGASSTSSSVNIWNSGPEAINNRTVVVHVLNDAIFQYWPAIGIWAGFTAQGTAYVEASGAAYLSVGGAVGACQIITNPPPLLRREASVLRWTPLTGT